MQYAKVKSVSKEVLSRGPALQKAILETMRVCADVVGSTLGPGGMSVVIERQEERLPPMVTKDGVTVFKNLGFDSSTQHVIMEAARDAAIRTANEAGDGTTTATILAEALVRKTMEYCRLNPKVSPQVVVRRLQSVFKVDVEPFLRNAAIQADLTSPRGRALLTSVAVVSANGDADMAKAVLECFDLVGDDGNVTLIETSGPSGYEVERLEGYPVGIGYEDCCGKFYQGFINNQGRMICEMENPTVILYHGRLTDIYTAMGIIEKVNAAAMAGGRSNNIVFVATGFSETVLGHLYTNFQAAGSIKVYPLLAPLSQSKTGQYDFLLDLAALTGGQVFDPLEHPLDSGTLEELGTIAGFEASRFRSTFIGFKDELLILERVDQLKQQLQGAAILEHGLLTERIGKLTGGIAKLKVIGSSSGELREKRDRAEDAICAVRGAIKHGALPGGGWSLLQLREHLLDLKDPIVSGVLCEALMEPFRVLFKNAGFHEDEVAAYAEITAKDNKVFDLLKGVWVDPVEGGVLDSVPAVLEAVRNSLSIASLLGTCGGTVVFKRDGDLERKEAHDTFEYLRNANSNEADDRG